MTPESCSAAIVIGALLTPGVTGSIVVGVAFRRRRSRPELRRARQVHELSEQFRAVADRLARYEADWLARSEVQTRPGRRPSIP
jgi:hypothetical protein